MKIRRPLQIAILLIVAFSLAATLSLAQGVDYDNRGKRDPFISLIKKEDSEPVQMVAPPPLDQRPPGLAGLLISEVSVSGVVGRADDQMVILRGIDDMTYFAREQSKLFDGFIQEISSDQVVFIREQQDTRGRATTTKVIKQMQTEER